MNFTPSVIQVTSASFDARVRRSLIPVLVAVFRVGADEESALVAAFEEVASLCQERITFARLSLEECPELAVQLDLPAAPALLFFQAGKVGYQFIGRWSRRELTELLARPGPLSSLIPAQAPKRASPGAKRHG